jgi:hypothetical protein
MSMKIILLASLTIVAITAKAGDVNSPLLGHDTTVGGTTFHFGPPQIIPDPAGNGKWVPFPVHPALTSSFINNLETNSVAEFQNKLDLLKTPAGSLENGVVVGKATAAPTLNHDGKAYAGFVREERIEEESALTDEQALRNLATLQTEYRKNIKSGKWHKFVNGE